MCERFTSCVLSWVLGSFWLFNNDLPISNDLLICLILFSWVIPYCQVMLLNKLFFHIHALIEPPLPQSNFKIVVYCIYGLVLLGYGMLYSLFPSIWRSPESLFIDNSSPFLLILGSWAFDHAYHINNLPWLIKLLIILFLNAQLFANIFVHSTHVISLLLRSLS